jgi:hypothetical protein
MPESIEELRAVIVYLIKMLKSNAEMSARLSVELASVIESVRGLDPTFDEILEKKRLEVDQASDPLIRANLDRYDEMIQRVENREIF